MTRFYVEPSTILFCKIDCLLACKISVYSGGDLTHFYRFNFVFRPREINPVGVGRTTTYGTYGWNLKYKTTKYITAAFEEFQNG